MQVNGGAWHKPSRHRSCTYHGGATPIKYGLYSKVVPKEMKESYLAVLASEAPKSTLEHISLIDGVILPGALQRGEKAPTHEGQLDPLAVQLMAIECKNKLLKRLHDMEDGQKIKFTRSELERLIIEMVSIIAEYCGWGYASKDRGPYRGPITLSAR